METLTHFSLSRSLWKMRSSQLLKSCPEERHLLLLHSPGRSHERFPNGIKTKILGEGSSAGIGVCFQFRFLKGSRK